MSLSYTCEFCGHTGNVEDLEYRQVDGGHERWVVAHCPYCGTMVDKQPKNKS